MCMLVLCSARWPGKGVVRGTTNPKLACGCERYCPYGLVLYSTAMLYRPGFQMSMLCSPGRGGGGFQMSMLCSPGRGGGSNVYVVQSRGGGGGQMSMLCSPGGISNVYVVSRFAFKQRSPISTVLYSLQNSQSPANVAGCLFTKDTGKATDMYETRTEC